MTFRSLRCGGEIPVVESEILGMQKTDVIFPDLHEAGYERAILSRLRSVKDLTAEWTLQEVLPKMRGAPPEIVIRLRPELANCGHFDASEIPSEQSNSYEPHPLDFDWRFREETIDRVAGLIGAKSKPIVLMGVGSLERTLRNRGAAVELFDRNPAIQHATLVDFETTTKSVVGTSVPRIKHPIVLLDSPWYVRDLLVWLNFAIDAFNDVSILYFALWPELVRPTASQEREFILERFETFGSVRIWKDYLSYDVPLFEQLAYRERGVRIDFCWRKGDLVEVRPRKQLENFPISTSQRNQTWTRVLLGKRQIAIRDTIDSEMPNLRRLEGAESWHLDSVSRRDPRRSQIDFWTSNNIVARLDGSREFVSALSDFFGARKTVDMLTNLQQRALAQMAALNCVDLNNEARFVTWKHRE